MPKIQFTKDKPAIVVSKGENLMQALLEAQRPVASSCGGRGVCTRCVVEIVEGTHHLSSPTKLEENKLREAGYKTKTHRLSCQAKVIGDVCIDTPYW
jgi:2Fe-2S ferredoxin